MSAELHDRSTTPVPQTPTQMLTPKTPERRIDMSKQLASSSEVEEASEEDWDNFTSEHIMSLSGDSARRSVCRPYCAHTYARLLNLILY